MGTDFFVLVGVVIHKDFWKARDQEFKALKRRYELEGYELHAGWMIRHYPEQESIAGFKTMRYEHRRKQMERAWQKRLTNSRRDATATISSLRARYRNTRAYHHLAFDERQAFLKEVAHMLGKWEQTAVLAVSIDKKQALSVSSQSSTVFETSFVSLVGLFERFLNQRSTQLGRKLHGLMIQDQDQAAKRLTSVMHALHTSETEGGLEHIIETPLFVDSSLTSMVQLADLGSYALRRLLEKDDRHLWPLIELNLARFDDGSSSHHHLIALAGAN